MVDVNVNGTALVVEKGDVLVIAFDRSMSALEFDDTAEKIKAHLEGVRVMLLTDVSALAVIKDVPDNRPDPLVDN